MPANTQPIFTLTPNINWSTALLTAANTAYDGTGTVSTIFTAGANGAFVSKVRFKLGSTAGTSAATVARIFINNGSSNAVAANNILYDEITLPAIAQTQVAATAVFELILNIALPAGYKINVTLGTAPGGSTGWYASALGGDY
jgi:hypothetical protein